MKILRKAHTLFDTFVNSITKKDSHSILFYPHQNCLADNYDIFNGDSSNTLCLLKSIISDIQFDGYRLYVVYYHKDKLQSYIEYSKSIQNKEILFIYEKDYSTFKKAFIKCPTVFTDCDYITFPYRVHSQTIICLNYYAGPFKKEFHRWTNHGGFKRYLKEQKKKFREYDYHLSISDIFSKLIAVDIGHYYPHLLSLGFPRNDVLLNKHTNLRNEIEKQIGFKINHLITYVPTHRDYENPGREFYSPDQVKTRSIWGNVSNDELNALENFLEESGTVIIAKAHAIQAAQVSNVKKENSKCILFFDDLIKKINTSLYPILSISDAIISDYTSTAYDFLYTGRPIIYYFFDIDAYRAARGFFIEPIESICAGHLTYNINELIEAIKDVINGNDPYKAKREVLQQIFAPHIDNHSTERIKNFFFGPKKKDKFP